MASFTDDLSMFTPNISIFNSSSPSYFSSFSNSRAVGGTTEFLQSNTMIAKISFLLVCLVIFIILFKLGLKLISYLALPSDTIQLLKGMKKGNKALSISQSPALSGSKTIYRSKDQSDGIEFSYSLWLIIDDIAQQSTKYEHIFHKGTSRLLDNNIAKVSQMPGLYIDRGNNNLVLLVNTFNNVVETVTVTGVPLNKWMNVIIRVENRNVDIYVNGTIAVRHTLTSVPKQNYDDLYMSLNGGFSGQMSDMWYYNRGLSASEIVNITNNGPDLTQNADFIGLPPFFSLQWYLNQ